MTVIPIRKTVDPSSPLRYFEDLRLGETSEHGFTVTPEMVNHFGDAVLDYNPIHFDDEAAKATGLFPDGRIAHGLLSAGLLSGVFATEWPCGPGTVIGEMTMRFTQPVYVGSTIRAVLKIDELVRSRVMKTVVSVNVFNVATGKRCLTGSVTLILPSREKLV